jgi:glycosyltransferase involved in cell wall biosynthesis
MATPPITVVQITTAPEALKFVQGPVGHLQRLGFVVHAISSPGALLEDFARQTGVPVVPVTMLRRVSPLRDLKSLWQLLVALRRIAPDVVHAHTPKGGLLGMIAAWLLRVPVRIYHMRGLPVLTATGPKRVLLTLSEKVSCALADKVLCVSHSVRTCAIELGLSNAAKLEVLHRGSGQGVDAQGRFNPTGLLPSTGRDVRSKLGIAHDALVLGFVGRIVRDKGMQELTEAWQSLRDEFPNLHLLVVGPFEPQDPVPAATENILRTDPRIHLAGEDWNSPPFYAAMDLVVLPTYREGFPNVPLEAAAMELPVVATRIPGCVDAVEDNVTGLLVPDHDAQALAEAIRRYVSDPSLRRQHGEAGRVRALRDFRPEAIWEAMSLVYNDLLSQRGITGV